MVAGKSEREKERETHCLNQVQVKLKFQWNVILYQGKGFQTISNIHVIDYKNSVFLELAGYDLKT